MQRNHRFARYEILDELGRGGMGVVYRVRDLVERREVALKALRGDVDRLDQRRFEREIRALGALQHEGIVRIIGIGGGCRLDDSGEGRANGDVTARRNGDEPVHFTMELVRGTPLSALIEPPLPGRDEVLRRARLVVRLLDALDAVHRAGFVHRDLKAADVLVVPSDGSADPRSDPDPGVTLLDFGLVLRLDEERPDEQEGGTALYLAPERVDPRATLDARSDLYSIGVLLYQLVTLRYPFERLADALASRRAPPRPPHEINPDCPVELSKLICGQLSREPHRRASSAAELRRDLIIAAGVAEAVPPRVQEPVFCGRRRELEVLEDAARSAADGRGRCVVVRGAASAGKTWLHSRSGLRASAALDLGMACFEGRYQRGGPVREGLRSVLAAMLLQILDAGDEARQAFAPWGRPVARLLGLDAFDSGRIGEFLESSTRSDDAPAEEALRLLAIRAATQVFALAARRQPALVVIEDLHNADELDIEILRRVAAVISGLPLALVVTSRTASRGESFEPALDAWLEEAEKGAVESIRLEGLADPEVERMAATMLEGPDRPSPELLTALITETGGLPGRVADQLRDLWTQGRLTRADGQWLLRPEAGAGAEGSIETAGDAGAVESLEEPLRRILAAASVVDGPFDAPLLAALLAPQDDSPTAEEIGADLTRLVSAGYLAPASPGLRFSAPAVRRRARGLCDDATRREYHRRLARFVLAAGGGEESRLAAARALSRAGDAEAAAAHYLEFAGLAEARGAHRRSLASYQRAIESLTDRAARSAALEAKGRLHGRIGELAPALECLREAAALREDDVALLPLLEEEGTILQKQGDFDPALRVFERCLAIAAGDERWEPRLLYRLGSAHFHRGELDAAEGLFARSLERYRAVGDHLGMAMVCLGQGLVEKRRGELEKAIAHIEEAIRHGEAGGHRDQLAKHLHNLANLHRARGDHARAIECLKRSMSLRESLGDRLGIAICLNNLSRTHAQRGEIRRALEAARDALQIFGEVGDKVGVIISRGNIGSFEYYRGHLDSAALTFERNLQLARSHGDARSAADCLYGLGRIENARGHPAEAERRLAEALRTLPESGSADLRALYSAELALSRIRLRNREGATDALRDGRIHAAEVEGQEVQGLLSLSASELHLWLNDLDEAMESARAAVEALERTGWKHDVAVAHRQLACVFREIGPDWIDHTEKHFAVARRLFEEMENRLELGITAVEEATLLEYVEEVDETRERLELAVKLFEETGATPRARDAATRLEALESH